jgi:hypothetical protein
MRRRPIWVLACALPAVAAVATHDSVFVARADKSDGRISRPPLVERELDWS